MGVRINNPLEPSHSKVQILTIRPPSGVAYVRGGDAAYYVLGITPPGQAKIIAYWPTGTAWFVRPIEFAISAGYACYFYKETPYGPGERIGEFQGPIQASFDDFFAAFYSCWRVVLDNPS